MLAGKKKSKGDMPPTRTRPVRRAAPQIGRFSANVFAKLARKTKYVDPALADHWPSIAGAELAGLCRPGRLTGMRQSRTLEVYAASSAAAAKLQMLSEELLQRVNSYYGPTTVTRIAIRRSSQPPSIGDAEDDETALGQALSRFRAAINGGKSIE